MQIKLDTGNDAFRDGSGGRTEISRILRELADKIERGDTPTKLMDMNGNSVGKVEYGK